MLPVFTSRQRAVIFLPGGSRGWGVLLCLYGESILLVPGLTCWPFPVLMPRPHPPSLGQAAVEGAVGKDLPLPLLLLAVLAPAYR